MHLDRAAAAALGGRIGMFTGQDRTACNYIAHVGCVCKRNVGLRAVFIPARRLLQCRPAAFCGS